MVVTYILSLIISGTYLYSDILKSKTKVTITDLALIIIPIVNTVVSLSIIIIEVLLFIHYMDSKINKNK